MFLRFRKINYIYLKFEKKTVKVFCSTDVESKYGTLYRKVWRYNINNCYNLNGISDKNKILMTQNDIKIRRGFVKFGDLSYITRT